MCSCGGYQAFIQALILIHQTGFALKNGSRKYQLESNGRFTAPLACNVMCPTNLRLLKKKKKLNKKI
jgi:hypothetical protein